MASQTPHGGAAGTAHGHISAPNTHLEVWSASKLSGVSSFYAPFLCAREVAAADKGRGVPERRQRRGMVGAEYQMAAFINEAAFLLCRGAPEHEGNMLGTGRHMRDQGVRQGFPTLALMAVGLALFDRQAGIQEQSALLRPRNKAASGLGREGPGFAQVTLAFFEDIAQRRRQRLTGRDGKSQTFGLSAPMVGVLTEDDGVHRVQRRELQGPQRPRRKNDGTLFYPALQKGQQGLAFSGLEKAIDYRLPVRRRRPITGIGTLQTRLSGFLGE